MPVAGTRIPEHLEQVAAAFRVGVEVYAREQSPLYVALARAGAEDLEILELASHGMAGAPPVHLFISAHYLLLGGIEDPLARYFPTLTDPPLPPEEAWPHFRRFALAHYDEIKELLRTRSVQMTYAERCGNLLAPMCHVADRAGEPLNLIELGCSAGVLLMFDRYAYDQDGRRIGPDDAPFVLRTDITGGPQLRIPAIGRRTGIDLNIIDPRSEEDRRWMLATCFPEQRAKQAHLAQAMDIVAGADITWLEGDALARLPEALAATPDPVCVYHSACLFYWPAEARAALDTMLREASRTRTIWRFGIEPSERSNALMTGAKDGSYKGEKAGGEITVTRYEGGGAEARVVAESDASLGKTWWYG